MAGMSSDPTSGRGGRLFRGPPAYEPRTPWGPWAGLAAVAAIVGLSILGAAILSPLLNPGGGAADLPDGQGKQISILRVVALWQALIVALTLVASIQLGGRVRGVLALRAVPGGWRTYAVALAAMALLQLLLAGIQHGLLNHDMLADLRPFIDLAKGPDWLVMAAVVGIGAPFSEELLFRGFLLAALARTRLGFWGAAVLSTLLWAALHAGYTAVSLAEVFVIGLFLSWLLWRTGSLSVAIFCHAAYNGLILLALRFVDLPAPG
jgi:membrane protease YdiL (CAAX protease family)